jgi:uncharacterized damage-inducible protein DinB
MNTRDMLGQHYGLMYRLAATNLAGISPEQSLAQPSHGGNCANWILGHMVNVHNGIMQLLGEKPVWESEQLARAGFEPITGPANAIDWNTLRDRFLESRERCLGAIASISDKSLAEPVPHPFGGTCAREELLSLLALHQNYHVGQLGMSRRTAGLPGAVKGPGQPQEAGAAKA